MRLYTWFMASRLLNVRLTPEDERIVARLKARGISISALMRRALRAEDLQGRSRPPEAEQLIADILALYPTPAETGRQRTDATDRTAVRKHIQKRLRARG
jgi:lambda repressor-like predicted transcriptional regulator